MSDIWSLGVITFLLLSGETPFGGLDGENFMSVKANILRAEVLFEPAEIWKHVSDDGRRFVKRLLHNVPSRRPTAKEAQKDPWIQVWSKKDTDPTSSSANPHIIGALMAFKEKSDMQKLISEVLSFTLVPEQIVELRKEFEKMDTNGDGEISLESLKLILLSSAEAGELGALTEEEVEALFDSIRVRKTDTTIRWHEFLAAGLSQARVDDRNLRLAFDRMDSDRKG
jgi:calcium-dependent protein kinase